MTEVLVAVLWGMGLVAALLWTGYWIGRIWDVLCEDEDE